MKTPVFGYLRTSGPSQIGNDGFERQEQAIQRFCRVNKMELARTFTDEAVSGTKDGFDRDGLTEMMLALKANGINTFIVESASRLARDLMVQEIILSDCRKHSITVFDASGIELTVNDDDPTRKMVRQILGAVSEFEKSSLVQKLAASRRRIRKSGKKCEGAPSYLDLNHPAVPIVALMRKKNHKYQTIIERLEQEEISTIRGGPWTRQQVAQIWEQVRKKKSSFRQSILQPA